MTNFLSTEQSYQLFGLFEDEKSSDVRMEIPSEWEGMIDDHAEKCLAQSGLSTKQGKNISENLVFTFEGEVRAND